MPRLTILSDPIKCERQEHILRNGETLARALVRLWPKGLGGSWRIYRDCVSEANEIAAVDLPYTVAIDDEHYLVVLDMAGAAAWAAFQVALVEMAPALMFALAAQALAPKPPRQRSDDPDRVSPNNQIAGQTNTLRPGSRVPEILGRVRAYPDLLCSPVDVYNETQQTIGQMFVLGKGAYQVETPKLGETPLTSIQNADLDVYQPGELVAPFYVMKASREVGDVSLLGGDINSIPIAGEVDFIAAGKIMRTQELLPISEGKPIRVSATFFNNAVFWVNSVPPLSATTPPFDYLLDGPVVQELGANPTVEPLSESISFSRKIYYGNGSPFEFPEEDSDDSLDPEQVQFAYGWPGADLIPKVNDYVELRPKTGEIWRGRITEAWVPLGGRAHFWGIKLEGLDGVMLRFPSISGRDSTYRSWRLPSTVGAPGPGPGENANAPTNWYAAPMENPQEIWVDFAFPQGLAWFDHGGRRALSVAMKVEFRRAGVVDPQASVTFNFSYGTTTPMRFTRRVLVDALALPAGSSTIEVRVTRETEFYTDSSNNQYIQDSRWVRLAAVRQLISQTYPECTIMSLTLSNNRSASAIHDMALNVIATRILPTWTGSGWSAPAPTRKWADHFVRRCQAKDGANRADAQIDIAGIYALQATLDSFDVGKLGEISMTLDQTMDIDAELSQIADVARAVVYRVGRKIFVARDQANAQAIALFNARTKGPDGETIAVRMTGDADNDCVVVTWVDEELGWKQRDYRYPENALAINPLRVGALCANWQQVRRRAVFEWNKLKYRREQLSVSVTEDGRICRPGDVINVTDDISNLATCAGEVIEVAGSVLTLDRDVVTEGGSSFVILLRDNAGIRTDLVPCTVFTANKVQLTRVPSVAIKGRDSCTGTMFAFYRADRAKVRPWMVLGIETSGPYVNLTGTNYTEKIYAGDSAPMPPRPPPPNLS